MRSSNFNNMIRKTNRKSNGNIAQNNNNNNNNNKPKRKDSTFTSFRIEESVKIKRDVATLMIPVLKDKYRLLLLIKDQQFNKILEFLKFDENFSDFLKSHYFNVPDNISIYPHLLLLVIYQFRVLTHLDLKQECDYYCNQWDINFNEHNNNNNNNIISGSVTSMKKYGNNIIYEQYAISEEMKNELFKRLFFVNQTVVIIVVSINNYYYYYYCCQIRLSF